MSFDTLAPHYRWMEWVFARDKMQRCRTAFLDEIPPPSRILLCGEGNGRFLKAVHRRFPGAEITVVDSSSGMLRQARRNLERAGLTMDRVTLVKANVLTWEPPPAAFDLIVTCFFLDCFRADELKAMMPRLARAAAPQAHWLQADFQVTGSWLNRFRSRMILRFLYAFFRQATHITARVLTNPEPLFREAGFTRCQRREMDGGRMFSEWWNRGLSGELIPAGGSAS